MADLTGFDANVIEPNSAFEPLAPGWYKCVIIGSVDKPTKAKTGSFIELTLEVIDGPSKGRKVFDRLNLNNPNEQAVQIAKATLSSICRSVGVMTPRDTSDLHDKPLMVKVAVRPASGGYDASNDIKGYDKVEASAPSNTGGIPW